MFSELKSIIKNLKNIHQKSFLRKRFFNGVSFRNPDSIKVSINSNIEKDSVILVTDPIDLNSKKIVIEDFCWIGRNVEIQSVYNSKIIINDFVSIQDRCKLLGSVYIGKYSILAPDIFISSGNHYFNTNPFLTIREQDIISVGSEKLFEEKEKPVVVEEDCWIGKNVFIKAGIYIGRGAIIGTNAIVDKDIEPYSINIGSPILKIKNRLDFIPKKEISAFEIKDLPYFYRGFEHYNPKIGIQDLIIKNNGIASENYSIIILEDFNYREIEIKGYSKCKGELKIFINGKESFFKSLDSEKFEFKIKEFKIKEFVLNNEYETLPDIIKKHLCIQFYFETESETKNNFYLSKISAL